MNETVDRKVPGPKQTNIQSVAEKQQIHNSHTAPPVTTHTGAIAAVELVRGGETRGSSWIVPGPGTKVS